MCPPIIKSLLYMWQINLDAVVDHLEGIKELSEMFKKRGNCPQAPTESDLKRLIRFMVKPYDTMKDMLSRTEEVALYLYKQILVNSQS